MPIIQSKFRTGYYGQKIFLFCFISAIIGFLINLIVTIEELADAKTWLLGILILIFVYNIYNLCIKEFQDVTINDEIILFKNIITKRKTIIRFRDIARISSTTNTYKPDRQTTSNSVLVLEIELKNGKFCHFSENEYENYHELKRFIYEHLNPQ